MSFEPISIPPRACQQLTLLRRESRPTPTTRKKARKLRIQDRTRPLRRVQGARKTPQSEADHHMLRGQYVSTRDSHPEISAIFYTGIPRGPYASEATAPPYIYYGKLVPGDGPTGHSVKPPSEHVV
jgi:hypothetical protein